MNEEQRKALEAVLQYNWNDELNDYIRDENDSREVHVLRHLVTLDNLLRGVNLSPADYLPKPRRKHAS